MDFTIAGDVSPEPIGEGVHAFRADAVETAGVFVGALSELAAGVEVGEHQFDGGHAEFRVHIDRDTAAVIGDGDGAIDVDGDLDSVTVAGEMLIDGVIENLEYAVVKATHIGIADIHAWALADGLKAFEFVDLSSAILLLISDLGLCLFWLVWSLGHRVAERV